MDLANQESLALAREVDPSGERTIGVITKIDLMDAGTNALPLLEGKAFKLKHGYFGVKCRSQKDINDGVSISEAIKNEVRYFAEHPDYCKH
jgi:dynamin 1-like protein